MGRGLLGASADLRSVKCVLVACPCSPSGPISRGGGADISLNREVSAPAGRMYTLRHRKQRALGCAVGPHDGDTVTDGRLAVYRRSQADEVA